MNLTTLKGIIEGATEGAWVRMSKNGMPYLHDKDQAFYEASRTALPRAIGLIEEMEKKIERVSNQLALSSMARAGDYSEDNQQSMKFEAVLAGELQSALAQIESFKANVGGSDE